MFNLEIQGRNDSLQTQREPSSSMYAALNNDSEILALCLGKHDLLPIIGSMKLHMPTISPTLVNIDQEGLYLIHVTLWVFFKMHMESV